MFKRKGGGGQRPFEQCSKKLHFSYGMASLIIYQVYRTVRVAAAIESMTLFLHFLNSIFSPL